MPLSLDPELQRAVLLCIDDDEDILECEKSFLESFGYAVLTGPSGRRGLELASMCSIDVVMEKMSRLDLLRRRARSSTSLGRCPVRSLSLSGRRFKRGARSKFATICGATD